MSNRFFNTFFHSFLNQEHDPKTYELNDVFESYRFRLIGADDFELTINIGTKHFAYASNLIDCEITIKSKLDYYEYNCCFTIDLTKDVKKEIPVVFNFRFYHPGVVPYGGIYEQMSLFLQLLH